jgi:hypothetical protein
MNIDIKSIAEKYKKIIDKSHSADMRLLRWWMDLTQSGDMLKIRQPGSTTLTQFLSSFQPPVALLYSLDKSNDIDFAMWIEPADASEKVVYHGAWAKKSIRGGRKIFELSKLGFSMIFEVYENILVYTWQQELLPLHDKFGYNVIGVVPNFLSHKTVYHLHLSKENFLKSRLMNVGGL